MYTTSYLLHFICRRISGSHTSCHITNFVLRVARAYTTVDVTDLVSGGFSRSYLAHHLTDLLSGVSQLQTPDNLTGDTN